jgi:hypothetical protein
MLRHRSHQQKDMSLPPPRLQVICRRTLSDRSLCTAYGTGCMNRTMKRFDHGSGSIVTIASVAGLRGSAAIDPSYRCCAITLRPLSPHSMEALTNLQPGSLRHVTSVCAVVQCHEVWGTSMVWACELALACELPACAMYRPYAVADVSACRVAGHRPDPDCRSQALCRQNQSELCGAYLSCHGEMKLCSSRCGSVHGCESCHSEAHWLGSCADPALACCSP